MRCIKGRQLIRRLGAAGVQIIQSRGKGGHVVARYRDRQTTVPIHRGRDIGPNFIREIRKQLGLDPGSFSSAEADELDGVAAVRLDVPDARGDPAAAAV